ncbi:MAG: AI-2E family transporter, partial [Hyphomicrobiales bacterium]|nr:AI-2E family transporter [Hyphomicrobiales bacterium]
MSLQRQVTFWIVIAAIFCALLYLLSDVVMPFVAGMALAYFLDPVADRLERAGFGRLAATVIILIAFLLLFTATLLILLPILGQQLAGFIERLPEYVTRLQGLLTQLAEGRLGRLVDANLEQLKQQLGGIVSQSAKWLAALLGSLWSGGQAVAGVLSLFIITPIVAFYLLYDWDRMVAKIDSWLPRDHAPTIRKLAADIDTTLSAFVRGQGTSCLVLGAYYAIALSLTGLNFGLLIG